MRLWPGSPFPLGATYDGTGTNFPLFSEVAERVELCLFDDDGDRDARRPARGHRVRLARLPARASARGSATASACTARASPRTGLRCNPAKLLLDPYAKAVDGRGRLGRGAVRLPLRRPRRPRRTTPTARRYVPKSRRRSTRTSTGATTARRARRWHETVIYEVHVKGFTQRHPGVPRGAARHLRRARAPGRASSTSRRSASPRSSCCRCTSSSTTATWSSAGLRNYWGYNSIGYFAPHNDYAPRASAAARCRSSSRWSRRCTTPGIEVILDVVYNHTAEGNHLGPTLSFKGIDNPAYYRLVDDDPRYYMRLHRHRQQPEHAPPARAAADHGLACATGCTEMHVDGFRFDLASTLARELHEVDRLSAFFDLIQQDPVVSQVKLIAEPWDVGEGGYQVGNFPPLWSEWNGKYRDSDPRLLARRGPDAGRVRLPPHRHLATSTRTTAAGRTRRSTSSPRTTASRSPTSSPTTTSTTRPTARATATARRTTARGTAASRGRPTTRRSTRCAAASSATSSRRCCCRRACRCCSAATRSAAPRAATTTPTARTTRSPGSTGSTSTASCSPSRSA